jgi:peptidoglycan-associated lipoprotein
MRTVKSIFVILLAATMVWGTAACKSKKAGAAGNSDLAGVGLNPVNSGDLGEGMGDDRLKGEEQGGMFPAVLFDYDSAQVNPSEATKIEQVASYLRSNASAKMVVEGHCDERGSNEYNLALGERRALSIRASLVGLGIEADRVQTKSLGEERPVAPGHDESAWSQNRRGEFVIVR